MRWIRYEKNGGAEYGIVHGEGRETSDGDLQVEAVEGTPFGDHRATGERRPLSSVRLLVPVVPPTFYAAGLNYRKSVV